MVDNFHEWMAKKVRENNINISPYSKKNYIGTNPNDEAGRWLKSRGVDPRNPSDVDDEEWVDEDGKVSNKYTLHNYTLEDEERQNRRNKLFQFLQDRGLFQFLQDDPAKWAALRDNPSKKFMAKGPKMLSDPEEMIKAYGMLFHRYPYKMILKRTIFQNPPDDQSTGSLRRHFFQQTGINADSVKRIQQLRQPKRSAIHQNQDAVNIWRELSEEDRVTIAGMVILGYDINSIYERFKNMVGRSGQMDQGKFKYMLNSIGLNQRNINQMLEILKEEKTRAGVLSHAQKVGWHLGDSGRVPPASKAFLVSQRGGPHHDFISDKLKHYGMKWDDIDDRIVGINKKQPVNRSRRADSMPDAINKFYGKTGTEG